MPRHQRTTHDRNPLNESMFTIKAGNLELRLEMVRVDDLLQHERTLEETIRKLSLEFKNWANLQNPIIVDENNIVLDGNHRAGVFKALSFRYMPVCRLDYFNEGVKLRYWLRLIKGFDRFDELVASIESEGHVIKRMESKEKLVESLDRAPLDFGFQVGVSFMQVTPPAGKVIDAVDAYDVVQAVQEKTEEMGGSIEFIPCQYMSDPEFCNGLAGNDLVIWTPRINKKMVVDAALGGRVFAPKSTRHVIPARPLHVNVPIQWCREPTSIEEINDRFEKFLRKKTIRRFPPGQVINGRFYSEATYIFMNVPEKEDG